MDSNTFWRRLRRASVVLLLVSSVACRPSVETDDSSSGVVKPSQGATGVSKPSDYVDMGSGYLWQIRNLGAVNPWNTGLLYAWGELNSKSNFTEGNYKYSIGNNWYSKYDESRATTRGKTVLDPIDDVAVKELGGSWRIPSVAEWMTLVNDCTWTWTEMGGTPGSLVTAKNGNTLFLPASGTYTDGISIDRNTMGYYWTRNLAKEGTSRWVYVFQASRIYNPKGCSTWMREAGCPVRAVCKISD